MLNNIYRTSNIWCNRSKMNIIINGKCPECNNKEFITIYGQNKEIIEVYCKQCGLVVIENTLPSLEYLQYYALICDENEKENIEIINGD